MPCHHSNYIAQALTVKGTRQSLTSI